jgi:putative restriction endonuclease
VKFYISVKDKKWFEFLRDRKADEVNFWRSSPKAPFRALPTGGRFPWKMYAPRNFIVGGRFFDLADHK